MDKTEPKTPIVQPHTLCHEGTAWTCTVICETGTRAPAERLFGAPGAEMCAVSNCSCQPLPYVGFGAQAHQAADVVDTGLPLALIVFGLKALIAGPKP